MTNEIRGLPVRRRLKGLEEFEKPEFVGRMSAASGQGPRSCASIIDA